MKLRFGIIGIAIFVHFQIVMGQILDDSTMLVYGPGTTSYTYERNIKTNDLLFVNIDTSIVNIHRYTTTELSEYNLQDLGVMGTATRNIYYTPPTIIGVSSGYKAYNVFFKDLNDFRYYDSKSPYSRIGVALGGNSRSRVNVGFNRSDSSNFNIGIDYNRVVTDKQVSSIGRHDRLSDSEGYDAYFIYFTANRRYLVLSSFSGNKVTAVDQGGIDTTGGFSFFDDQASVFLQNARSEFTQKKSHIYHQFSVHDLLQIYQSFTHSTEKSKFRVLPLSTDKDYFDKFYINEDTTLDVNTFVSNTLESGLKGNIGDKLFYLGYYEYRNYDFQYAWADEDTLNFNSAKPQTSGTEHYVGGQIRLALNKEYQLQGGLEVNLSGNQRLTGDLIANRFDVHLVTQQYEPSFLEKAYLGNHDAWINDFESIKTFYLNGGMLFKFDNTTLRPGAVFNTITSYVYFDKEAVPKQINGTITIFNPKLDFNVKFRKHLNLVGSANYSVVTGASAEALPTPDLSVNANFFYHNLLFEGNMEFQGGLDTHWNSSYFAQDYRVSTNQFFIQDRFEVPSYLIVDAYANIKLGHAYVFFKMNNLVQAFTKEGYFVAPNYVGKRNIFDFGFNWMFFD